MPTKTPLSLKMQFLPETYANYYYAAIIEEHGIMGGVIILAWLPALAFLLSFLMLKRKNMHLFYALLGGFFLINGFMIAVNRCSLFKTNLGAILVLLVAFVYGLVLWVREKTAK